MASVWPQTTVRADHAVSGVGGMEFADLAQRFGTPLYVMDSADMISRMQRYRAAAGPDVTVLYASKALCVTGVIRLAHQQGLGVDVASAGELATALRAGVPGADLAMHGNNKSTAELAMALDAGVGRIVVDSLDEIDRLASLNRPATVLLRLTPGIMASTHSYVATGGDDQKFGLSISHGLATRAVGRLQSLPQVHLAGLHVHIGSNISSAQEFSAGISTIAEFAAGAGIDLEELNLGGGLGIAYTSADRVPSIERHIEVLLAAVDAALPRRPRLYVEPGRSIVGPAGVTLYTVGTVKHVPQVRSFAAVDGGMSDNPRPSLYGARYTVAAVRSATNQVPYTLAGKHCESGDVLAHDVMLPADLRAGDLVVVAATGAYGHSMASNYNRLPRPAMVAVAQGSARLLVRRESLEDVLALDVG
ncbi:MAG: diaminopimelate decarboxylase [Euzebya sp.]